MVGCSSSSVIGNINLVVAASVTNCRLESMAPTDSTVIVTPVNLWSGIISGPRDSNFVVVRGASCCEIDGALRGSCCAGTIIPVSTLASSGVDGVWSLIGPLLLIKGSLGSGQTDESNSCEERSHIEGVFCFNYNKTWNFNNSPCQRVVLNYSYY